MPRRQRLCTLPYQEKQRRFPSISPWQLQYLGSYGVYVDMLQMSNLRPFITFQVFFIRPKILKIDHLDDILLKPVLGNFGHF